MTETGDVVFDAKSGISVEEQKEILSQINGIAEKNRRSLSQHDSAEDAGKKRSGPIDAKKTGAFFPLAFNIAAVVVLLAGAFLLISFNGKVDALVRRGTAVFNLTEREIIEEIRRDTAEKIRAKDLEISLINSRLEEVDAQLALLSSGNQVLSAQQIQTQERLLSTQNSYRAELAVLQDERAQILESSRSREAALRAQLAQGAGESAADRQRASSEIDLAISELERLTTEQEKIAAIEAFLAGGLDAITGGAQPAQTSQNVGAQEQELAAKNAELEKTIASLRQTIDSLDSGGTANARRLVELEEAVSTLRAQVSSLETGAAEKDRTISSLQGENANLSQTVTSLQSANAAQEQEITSLRNQLAIIRQALQE